MFRYILATIFLYTLLSLGNTFAEMKDPTRPATLASDKMHVGTRLDSTSPWVLTSTLVSPQRTLATINGQVVAKGEQVNKATVVTITSNSVLLREGSREFRIMLTKPSIRTTSRRLGSK